MTSPLALNTPYSVLRTRPSLFQRVLDSTITRRVVDAGFVRYARRRMAALDAMNAARFQEFTLLKLLRQAGTTRFGRDHDFPRIRAIEDYHRLVPLRDYEAFWKDYWRPAFPRLGGVTWPTEIPYVALSSGTTSGTTKNIPISRAMMKSNTKAALTMLSAFVNTQPDAGVFRGQLFFLGGSTDLVQLDDGILAGDLSGIVTRDAPAFLRPFTFPPLDLALLSDWEVKVQALAEAAIRRPITMISGVPAWLLILFAKLKQITDKATIRDIWPQLRLVIHGGTKFDPYRELFTREVGPGVRFLESYPCSEGFVAFEDPRYELLRLIPDHGVFFEFVPVAELEKQRPTRHTLANFEIGVQYAVVVTTCAGLWSYVIGDTVAFERRHPPLLRFTGRTKYYLSAFGEHLISEEVEKAITAAAKATGTAVLDFHVGPHFPEHPGELGRHLYLVEFTESPAELSRFARTLDDELNRLNDDYRAHRAGGIGMGPPEVCPVARGAFAAWMRSQGKLGGQHKVPRMDNSGVLTKELAKWMAVNGNKA